MPHWEETKVIALKAHSGSAAVFVGWDIAVTPDGPVLLEGNSYPDVDFPQRVRRIDIGHSLLGAPLHAAMLNLERRIATGTVRRPTGARLRRCCPAARSNPLPPGRRKRDTATNTGEAPWTSRSRTSRSGAGKRIEKSLDRRLRRARISFGIMVCLRCIGAAGRALFGLVLISQSQRSAAIMAGATFRRKYIPGRGNRHRALVQCLGHHPAHLLRPGRRRVLLRINSSTVAASKGS